MALRCIMNASPPRVEARYNKDKELLLLCAEGGDALRRYQPQFGIVSERVSGEIRDRLADRFAQLTPEQRAMVHMFMRERIADELRERLADRIADGLSQLSPEQRDALRTALKQRVAAQVREGLSDRFANQLSDGQGD
jgi:hypothetical protein